MQSPAIHAKYRSKRAVNKLEVANKEYEKVFEKIIALDEQLLA
jgi:hypothetical protein